MTTTIVTRVSVAGLHRWPDAPAVRDYLRCPHRHLFGVEVEVEVSHGDRAVEFHDLGELSIRAFRSLGEEWHPDSDLVNFGSRSCEVLAELLGDRLAADGFRVRRVAVSEDGENVGVWAVG